MKELSFSKNGTAVTLSDGGMSKKGARLLKLSQKNSAIAHYEYGTWSEVCNAVFYGNKIFFFFLWTRVSASEKETVQNKPIHVVLCPFKKTIQFIVKLGSYQWGDVICHFPGPKEYNNESKPVDSFVFVLIDSLIDEVVAMREVTLPEGLAKYLGQRSAHMMDIVKTRRPEIYKETHSAHDIKKLEKALQMTVTITDSGEQIPYEWFDRIEDALWELFDDETTINRFSFETLYNAKGSIILGIECDAVKETTINK